MPSGQVVSNVQHTSAHEICTEKTYNRSPVNVIVYACLFSLIFLLKRLYFFLAEGIFILTGYKLSSGGNIYNPQVFRNGLAFRSLSVSN